MKIDSGFVAGTLAELVRINSINPAFSDNTTDESAIAAAVGKMLRHLGALVEFHEPAPRRTSVSGRIRGSGGGKSLMLYAHHDTVGIEGMSDPFSGAVREGKLYGRGAYDMKCGLAACLGAVQALKTSGVRLQGDLVIVGVADEEVASIGMADVLTRIKTDGAIVTEPTDLEVCVAHKGFLWLKVTVHGRAAHGSRYDEGVDANMRMGRVLARLDVLEQSLRRRPTHPLLGTPSLHAAVLAGGTGASTYAARSVLEIERRTLPDESDAAVVAEIQEILDAEAARDPSFKGEVEVSLSRPGFETSSASPLAAAVRRAAAAHGGERPPIGVWYWMDASLMARAGTETVVYGPAGQGAHSDVEWVDLASVDQTASVLAEAAMSYCGMA